LYANIDGASGQGSVPTIPTGSVGLLKKSPFFAVAIIAPTRRFDIFFALLSLSTSPWRLETPRLNTGKGFEYLVSELTLAVVVFVSA